MAFLQLHPLSDEETVRLHSVYKGGRTWRRTEPGNVILPATFEKFKHGLKNWQVRPNDIYIFGFLKSGTTWTQELVWLVSNDCDFEKAKTVQVYERCPYLEGPALELYVKNSESEYTQEMMKRLETMQSPRIFKTHLRLFLLPDDLLDKSKVVLCLRNPKDVVVSYYHHEKLYKAYNYDGDFATYFDLFMDDLVFQTPFFEYIKNAWKMKNHPNVCLLFYEDMKRDQSKSVRKVAEFLGKDLTEKQVEALVEHLSFKNMKTNIAVNQEAPTAKVLMTDKGSFMRKGEVGDWKNYFTEEMNKRMDEAIEKHFKPIGLEFQYE